MVTSLSSETTVQSLFGKRVALIVVASHFALDLEDGSGERCEILTGEDNIQTSGNSILAWQKVSLGIQEQLVVYELELLPEMLNSSECRTMDELGATKFESVQSGFRSLERYPRDGNGWFLLFRTNLEVALYESGQLVWRRDLSDDSLSANLKQAQIGFSDG